MEQSSLSTGYFRFTPPAASSLDVPEILRSDNATWQSRGHSESSKACVDGPFRGLRGGARIN